MKFLSGIFSTITGAAGGWQLTLAAAVLSAGLAGFAGYKVEAWHASGTISDLQGQVQVQKMNVGTAKANTQRAWDAYGALDVSLHRLLNESKARTADAEGRLAALGKENAANQDRVKRLLAAKPAPGEDLGQAADALILESLQ